MQQCNKKTAVTQKSSTTRRHPYKLRNSGTMLSKCPFMSCTYTGYTAESWAENLRAHFSDLHKPHMPTDDNVICGKDSSTPAEPITIYCSELKNEKLKEKSEVNCNEEECFYLFQTKSILD